MGCVSSNSEGMDGMEPQTPEQMQQRAIIKVFEALDTENKNRITIGALLAYLQQDLLGLTTQDLKAFLVEKNIQNQCEINFDQLRVLILQASQQQIMPQDSKNMIEKVMQRFLVKQLKQSLQLFFDRVDIRRTGFITMVQLCDQLEKEILPGLTVEGVRATFKQSGVSESDWFSFQNFWVLHKQATQQQITMNEERYTIDKVPKDAVKNEQKIILKNIHNNIKLLNKGVATVKQLIEQLNQNAINNQNNIPGLDIFRFSDMMTANILGDAADIPFEFFYVIFKLVTGQPLEKKEEKYNAMNWTLFAQNQAGQKELDDAFYKWGIAFAQYGNAGFPMWVGLMYMTSGVPIPGITQAQAEAFLKKHKVYARFKKVQLQQMLVTFKQILGKPLSATDCIHSLVVVTPQMRRGNVMVIQEDEESEEEEQNMVEIGEPVEMGAETC